MRLIAHRGYAGEHPENTLPAVRGAAETADCVEVDVRRCASGDLVVVHDETVDRVTDAAGPVADFTAEELASLDVLGSGAGVPRLEEVFAALPADVGLNVELKEPETAADAVRVADRHPNPVLVSAFDDAALRRTREADPAVPRAYLFDHRPGVALDRARDLGCSAVHPKWTLCLRSRLVRRAHDAGLSVNAWTVGGRTVARTLRVVGVDGVVADRHDVLETGAGTSR